MRRVISRDPLHHGTWRHIWDKWIGIEVAPRARISGQAISIHANAVMVAIAIYGAKHDILPGKQHELPVTVVTGHAGGVVIVIPGPGVPPIPPFWDSIRHDVLVGLAQKLEAVDAQVDALMRKSKAKDAK